MDQIDASHYIYYSRQWKLAVKAVVYIYYTLFLAKNNHFLISYDKWSHLPALQSWPGADFGQNWPFLKIFFLASESSQWTKLMLHTTYITLGIDNKLLKLYYPYITPYFWLKTTIFWFLMTNYPISLLCRAGLVMCNLTQRLYQIKYVARWRREWYLWTLCHCSAGAGFNHQSIFNMHISAQQSKVVIWYFLPALSISVVKPIDSLLTNWGWNVPSSDQLKLSIHYLLLWLPTLLN